MEISVHLSLSFYPGLLLARLSYGEVARDDSQ